MKILKNAFTLLALFGHLSAYSQIFSIIPSFDFEEIISTEKKFILCVFAENNKINYWAKKADGSYAYVRGNIYQEVPGLNKFDTPVVTELFRVRKKYMKEIFLSCPKNYYAQPADSYSKKLYQTLLINIDNEFIIFPGFAEVPESVSNLNMDSLAGISIG